MINCANQVFRVFASALLICVSGFAQNWFSVGVKGGAALTDAFADRNDEYAVPFVSNPFGFPITYPVITEDFFHTYSNSPRFVVGPFIEVKLPLNFSLESDALYKPLSWSLTQRTQISIAGVLVRFPLSSSTSFRVDNWEFPLLTKYRFPVRTASPFLELGPSFRADSALRTQRLSNLGATAGAGVETHLGHLALSTELRYTHWANDSDFRAPYRLDSRENQFELLVGASSFNPPNANRAKSLAHLHRFLLGVRGGIPFTTAFLTDSIRAGNFSANSTVLSTASKNYLIGPEVDIRLPSRFSIEADALYHPLDPLYILASKTAIITRFQNVNSWEFPVLGKYCFGLPMVNPYVEAGPTFRSLSSPLDHYFSNAGVSAGVGVEVPAWKFLVSPEVRYVHWGNDSGDAFPFYSSRRNQAEFLVGLTY